MNNKLIFCIVLFGAIFVSGCINTPLDNINELMPDISNNVVDGDKYYNESVTALNSKNYAETETKANLALERFKSAKNDILEANKYYEGVNETLFIEYINILEDEVDLKINATSNLILASQKYEQGEISEGNKYSSLANSKMDSAIEFQNQRIAIVDENPELFKEFFYF
ncbi:hypothetical protein [Methanobrevibacter sp. DSM 116169]|uniref:hypothetical protein n=1 Tax=Methanobrevibacter sp. DSM 116169 TaxID=3242727 RepID=UPI0038FC5DEA